MSLRLVVVVLALARGLAACAPGPRADDLRARDAPAARDPLAADGPRAERAPVLRGVPDRGRDPSVVALDIGGSALCSGTLVSPRLVLTARHCVSRVAPVIECPPQAAQVAGEWDPSEITVVTGDDYLTGRRVAHGIEVIAPSGLTLCEADIAFLALDVPVATLKPLPIRQRGPAVGDAIRTVGFGKLDDEGVAGRKILREHVEVLDVTPAEFRVGESTCHGDSGGPGIDEDTGEVIGVVSRGGASCDGPDAENVYTRVDTYAWLVEEAFQRIAEIEVEEKTDAGSKATLKPAKRGTKDKPEPDVGTACVTADDCAAGVCITEVGDAGTRRYCSRPCGGGGRCPTRYHCKPVQGLEAPGTACINVR